jgi:hypothetical protein
MSMTCASWNEICFEDGDAQAVLLLGDLLDDERKIPADEEPLSPEGRKILEDAIFYLWDRQGPRVGQSRAVYHYWWSQGVVLPWMPCDCDFCLGLIDPDETESPIGRAIERDKIEDLDHMEEADHREEPDHTEEADQGREDDKYCHCVIPPPHLWIYRGEITARMASSRSVTLAAVCLYRFNFPRGC